MIRLSYDSKHLSGQLACSFCGKSYELDGNVRTYRDEKDIARTQPDARNKVYSHFHYSQNAWIDECPAVNSVRDTTWEAVDLQTGEVVARGRVVVPELEHSIGPISVRQDEPEPL
jgi:hypothetical protein